MAEESAQPAGAPERDLQWYASKLDQAGACESRYMMALAIREELGCDPVGDLHEGATPEETATVWAVDYHIEVTGEGSSRRATLAPRNNFSGTAYPPELEDVSDAIKTTWRELLELVNSGVSKARLAHLLFECGGPQRHIDATTAIESYLSSAHDWRRRLDVVDDLGLALRLARAMGDEARTVLALEGLLDVAEAQLNDDTPLAGPVLRAFDHVVHEPLCPDRVDAMLDRAANELLDSDLRDRALRLIHGRCKDDACRRNVWHRRVDAYIQMSKTAEGILRLVYLQDALAIAEASSIPELREYAAAALQGVRDEDLGLIRFESSSAQYEELFERIRDSFIAGATWQQALSAFANAGPLTGDLASNRALVSQLRAANPLTSLMPVTLVGPDGLPILTATTDEEKSAYDLVRCELQRIQNFARPLISALHMVVERFGLPESAELALFLRSMPGITPRSLGGIARAMYRFWGGDSESVIYTLTPQIEALVRELILRTDRGIYKLRTTHKPGQFPGLGAMLPILFDEYEVSDSQQRFLTTVLTDPAGLNLRNLVSHGIQDYSDPGAAALLIHTALFIATLSPRESPVGSQADGSSQSPVSPSQTINGERSDT
jgi:hypothetical protein